MNLFALDGFSLSNNPALLDALLAVVALSTIAALAGRALHRRPALRHAVLLVGLVCCLAAPLVVGVLNATGWKLAALRILPPMPFTSETRQTPAVESPLVPEPRAVAHEEAVAAPPESVIEPDPLPISSTVPETFASIRLPTTQRPYVRAPFPWQAVLLLAWLTGTCVLTAFVIRAWVRVWTIRRTATRFTGRPEAASIVKKRLQHLLLGDFPALLLSQQLHSPVATGILNPAVILPADALEGIDDEELTDILVHETAHIVRRDPLVLLVQASARCLFWPIPVVHWLNRQLESAREEICDNYVLAERNAVQYGQTLLKMAERACGQPPLPAAAGMLRRGGLETRIVGLLDPQRNTSVRLPRAAWLAIVGAFVLASLVVSGTRLVAQSEAFTAPPSDSRPGDQPKTERPIDNGLDESPMEETRVPPQPAPDPRLFKLPLEQQICEKLPPVWAIRLEESAGWARNAGQPLILADGRLLWAGRLFELATGKLLREFPLEKGDAISDQVCLSDNRKFLLVKRTTGFDPSRFVHPGSWYQVWDVSEEKRIGENLGSSGIQQGDADLSPDGQTVAVLQGKVTLWDAVSGNTVKTLPVNLDKFEKGFEGRPAFFAPEFLRFSPDGQWLVVFSPNNVVYWKWKTDEEPRVIHVGRRLEEFVFTPDSRYLAEGPGPRGNIELRDMTTLKVVKALEDEVKSPLITSGIIVTPDGRTLIANNNIDVDENKLKIPHRLHAWELATGKLKWQMAMPLHRPRFLDVSPDGRYLVGFFYGEPNTILATWDLKALDKAAASLDGAPGAADAKAPNGRHVALNQPPPKNPPKEAAPARETIVGTVVHRGKPVSGIQVRAFRGSILLDEQFKTDEAGQIRVPKEWRSAEGFLSVVAHNANCIGWFDFYMHERADQGGQKPADGSFIIEWHARTHTVRGRLISDKGQPQAGVVLRVDTLNHQFNLMSTHWDRRMVDGKLLMPSVTTDSEGRYELRLPQDSSATVGIDHPDWVYARFPVSRDVMDLGDKSLVAAAKVSGRLVDPAGQPIAGAEIVAFPKELQEFGRTGDAKTDKEGRFTIGALSAGKFDLRLAGCPDVTLCAPDLVDVVLKSGETLKVTFAVAKGRKVSGKVLDMTDGHPLANCRVTFVGPNTGSTQTDAHGEFVLHVSPGKIQFYVSDERERGDESDKELAIPSDGALEPLILKAGAKSPTARIRILVSEPLDRKVSVKAEQMPLREFLEIVCNQAGLQLDLDEEMVATLKPTVTVVTVDAKDEPLGALLKKVFAATTIDFTTSGRKLHVGTADWIKPLRKK